MPTFTGTNNLYNHVSERLGDGGIDLDNNSFEVLLTTSSHTPLATHTTISDITNEVTGNGYARQSLGSVTWNLTGNSAAFDFADPQFAASGGDIVARYWHVRDTTNDLLIAWGLIDNTPADVTTTDGNTLDLEIDAAGLFTLAPA